MTLPKGEGIILYWISYCSTRCFLLFCLDESCLNSFLYNNSLNVFYTSLVLVPTWIDMTMHYDVAWRLSSNIVYQLGLWTNSSTRLGRSRDTKLKNNVLGNITSLIVCIIMSMLTLSNYRIARQKIFMNFWLDSPQTFFTWNKPIILRFCFTKRR